MASSSIFIVCTSLHHTHARTHKLTCSTIQARSLRDDRCVLPAAMILKKKTKTESKQTSDVKAYFPACICVKMIKNTVEVMYIINRSRNV